MDASSFTPRDWVLAELDGWLEGTEAAILVVGSAGCGKTAIGRHVAALSEGADVGAASSRQWLGTLTAVHFCDAADIRTVDPLAWVKSLSEQIGGTNSAYRKALLNLGDHRIEIHGDADVGYAAPGASVAGVVLTVNIGAISAGLAFERLVRAPLSQLASRGAPPIVILVDALDESLTLRSEETIASVILGYLRGPARADGPRFLLTSRRDRRVLDRFDGRIVDLDGDRGAGDVERYVRSRLSTVFPEAELARLGPAIAAASDGNFLYAYHVTREAAEGVIPAPDDLPLGLTAQYERFVERDLARDDQLWRTSYRKILGLFSISEGEGLGAGTIAAAAEISRSEVDDAVRLLEPYLAPAPSPGGPRRLYHDSFREFLRLEGRYHVYPEEAEDMLVAYLVSSAPPQDERGHRDWADGYARRHLPTHASRVGRLHEVLLDLGLIVYGEPYVIRSVLLADGSRSPLDTTFRMAFHRLPGADVETRSLALTLTAVALGYSDLQLQLASALPRPSVEVAWSAVDPPASPLFYRPSLEVRTIAGGLSGDEGTVALVADLAEGVILWRPATGGEQVLPGRPEPGPSLRFVVLDGQAALVEMGHMVRVVDCETGRELHHLWAPGPAAAIEADGRPYLVEGHPVGGDLWLRPFGSAELWDRQGDTLRPSAAQAATPAVASLPGRVSWLWSSGTPPRSVVVALTDDHDVFAVDFSRQLPRVVGPLARTASGALDAFALDNGPTAPLVAVAPDDQAVSVFRIDSGDRVADLAWPDLAAAVGGMVSSQDYVTALEFVQGRNGSVLLIATRAGHLLEWEVGTDRIRNCYRRIRSMSRLAGSEGDLVVTGGSDGTRIWELDELFAEMPDERGEVELVTSCSVAGASLVSWMAMTPTHPVVWTADESGTVVDRVDLPARDFELLAQGRIDGDLAVVALGSFGASAVRRLCVSSADSPIPAETLSRFLLGSVTVAHPYTNSDMARVLYDEIGRPLAHDGMGYFPSADGAVMAVTRLSRPVMIRNVVDGWELELSAVGLHGDDPMVESIALGNDRGLTAVAAVVKQDVADRLLRCCVVEDRHAGPWLTLASSTEYVAHVAVGRFGMRLTVALADLSGVRLLSPTGDDDAAEDVRSIPLPALAVGFDPSGRLLIGTDKGLVCIRDVAARE